MKMKRIAFLGLVFMVCGFSVYGQTENDFQVALTADYTGAVITRYTGTGISALRIPETLQGFPVKEIGNRVFYNNTTITSVILPSSIEKIGDQAFYDCKNLTTVTIPSNVTNIEFETRVVERSRRDGGEYNTTNFGGCNLLFTSQVALKRRGYPHNFGSKRVGNYVVTLTNDNTGLVITYFGLENSSNKIITTADVSIPASIEGMPVKEIGPSSFHRKNGDGYTYNIYITNRLIIPEGVEVIRKNAFGGDGARQGQRFSSVVLPNTLKTIEAGAFSYCDSLNNIIIPEGVTTIGASAFSGCESLTQAKIPPNTRIIGNSAFSNCSKLSSVTIPEGVTEIGSSAFEYCYALTSIVLPSTVKIIGTDAFRCTGLTSITLPDALEKIENRAFSTTKLPLTIQAELRRKGYEGGF
jgi:hypothetical protein